MAELPPIVWQGVGALIGLASLFLGFLRPVEHSAFFKLMAFVGGGMFLFGFIKDKLSRKTPDQAMFEIRQRRLNQETEVDIDAYKNRSPVTLHHAQRGGPYSIANVHHQNHSSYQGHSAHIHTPQTTQHSNHGQHHPGYQPHHYTQDQGLDKTKSKFCHQCGSPLLSKHKFCPICGTRV